LRQPRRLSSDDIATNCNLVKLLVILFEEKSH
jgi:hypothetical protein